MGTEKEPKMLTAKNVHRVFETTEAPLSVLNGIDLELEKGSSAAICGASGVGKSTLLHILGGLDRPTEGSVKIDGVSLAEQSETDLAKFRNRKVGFVFQFHYLLEDFTALENVMMPLLVGGTDTRTAAQRGELLLEQLGLKDRTTHRPRQLSGGEQQRVAVARALANDPDVVLADEPSGNLDIATGRMLHDLLLQLNADRGLTTLIATHNRELAGQCHRQFDIVDGKIRESE